VVNLIESQKRSVVRDRVPDSHAGVIDAFQNPRIIDWRKLGSIGSEELFG
jgi:hypothetical protein